MSRIKTRNYISIFISILLLTFLACVGLSRRLESPTVHIADIAVKELKPLEAIFNVQLRVLNPNDTSIIAKGINFDLEINNNHLATGVSNAAIEIPAFGTAILPIEVFTSAFNVVRNIIALSDKKTLKYKIKGRLRLEGGSFMQSYISFEIEEDLDIKSLMEKP
ncbi:LEA type 2 family protein [Thermodesulfobacteriota bacterium]